MRYRRGCGSTRHTWSHENLKFCGFEVVNERGIRCGPGGCRPNRTVCIHKIVCRGTHLAEYLKWFSPIFEGYRVQLWVGRIAGCERNGPVTYGWQVDTKDALVPVRNRICGIGVNSDEPRVIDGRSIPGLNTGTRSGD